MPHFGIKMTVQVPRAPHSHTKKLIKNRGTCQTCDQDQNFDRDPTDATAHTFICISSNCYFVHTFAVHGSLK